ncbi:MAG: UxaA family hydrolase [Chloroflexota bacterium]
MSFLGYVRPDGSVGTRNYVGIISTVVCANDIATWISNQVPGCAHFTHQQGCGQSEYDTEVVHRTLAALGRNPNLGAVLLVSLGGEGSVDHIQEAIARTGKPVEKIVVHQIGGVNNAFAEGLRLARMMAMDISRINREKVDDSHLVLGAKCGCSDTTSGLASNPTLGAACDMVVEAGGTAVFGETTEMTGAEHVLARRGATPQVSERVLDIVTRLEKKIPSNAPGANIAQANIAGGLTTLEEKSLGAIIKAGTSPIRGVLDLGEQPSGKGLYIVDTAGQAPKAITGLAAAGATVMMFSTGKGAPWGFPFVPMIKVTANPTTCDCLSDLMDFCVDPTADETRDERGQRLYKEILDVASGKITKAEALKIGMYVDIWTRDVTH